MPEKKNPKLFYGYKIVAATFVLQHIAFGAYMTIGVFLDHVAAAFDWPRGSISLAYTIAFVVQGFSSFIGGALNDRFGPRVVVAVCILLFGLGHLLLSQLGALWQWYLFYCLIGLGIGAVEMVPLATVARWFVKRRGLMTGITKVGIGSGIMLVPPLASLLISAIGWQSAYMVLGALVLAIGIPGAQFLRRDPGKMNLLADGEVSPDETKYSYAEAGLTVREALHSWQLWVLCAAFLTNAFCMQTVSIHIAPHAKNLGYSHRQSDPLISVIGGVSIISRLVMGSAGDKIGNRRAMVICLLILTAALAWVQFADELWELYLFVALYGLNHGGIVTVISPLVAELFGTRSQGTLLGIVTLIGITLSALGPFTAGYLFDVYGGYQPAFLILLGFAVAGLILSLLLRPIRREE